MQNLIRLEEALTSKKWKFEFLEQDNCPASIYDFFLKHLPHLDKKSFEERLKLGGFYINGLSTTTDTLLKVPCKIEYYEPKFELGNIHNIYPEFSKEWVIYEDSHFIILFKPKGLPCLPTKEQNLFNLKAYVSKYCNCQIHMPSRLDTSTQGLVLISKESSVHNYLQKAFENKQIIKRYILSSNIRSDWDFKFVKTNITKSKEHAILREVSQDKGKNSITIFSKLNSVKDRVFYLARPLTGRTHQIRLHSSYIGIPITGDNFYGGIKSGLLNLLSYQIGFWHPFLKKLIDVKVPDKLMPEWTAGLMFKSGV